MGSARDQVGPPSGNLKTNLKFRESISPTKAILAKRFLLACSGITFEYSGWFDLGHVCKCSKV